MLAEVPVGNLRSVIRALHFFNLRDVVTVLSETARLPQLPLREGLVGDQAMVRGALTQVLRAPLQCRKGPHHQVG